MEKLSLLFPDFWNVLNLEGTEQLSAVFFITLWVVTLYAGTRFLIKYQRAKKVVNELAKKLESTNQDTIAYQRWDIKDHFKKYHTKNPAFHLWQEFDETLIEIKDESGHKLYNTYDASHFFNSHTLAREVTENRFFAAVPGFLTAIGVIGTFIGLQIGLSEINISSDATIEEMKTGVSSVIDGAKVAFITSVWGVGLSVAFNIFEKSLEQKIRGRISKLQNIIDDLFPRLSPESQLQVIAENSTESRESLQGLGEQIAIKLQESMETAISGMSATLDDSLNRIMAPAIDKLVNDTSEGNQKALESLLEKFMEGFGSEGAKQREAMEEAYNRLNGGIESIVGTMDDFMGKASDLQEQSAQREEVFTTKMQELIEKIKENLNDYERVSLTIIEQGKELQDSVKSSVKSNEIVSNNLKDSANSFVGVTDKMMMVGGQFERAGELLSTTLHDVSGETANLVKLNTEAHQKMMTMQDQFSGYTSRLEDVSKKIELLYDSSNSTFDRLTESQKAFLKDQEVHIGNISEKMSSMLSDYASKANGQTSDHLKVWSQTSNDYAAAMMKVVNALAQVVDEIEGTVEKKSVNNENIQ